MVSKPIACHVHKSDIGHTCPGKPTITCTQKTFANPSKSSARKGKKEKSTAKLFALQSNAIN